MAEKVIEITLMRKNKRNLKKTKIFTHDSYLQLHNLHDKMVIMILVAVCIYSTYFLLFIIVLFLFFFYL